jgi:hypothetical protein
LAEPFWAGLSKRQEGEEAYCWIGTLNLRIRHPVLYHYATTAGTLFANFKASIKEHILDTNAGK